MKDEKNKYIDGVFNYCDRWCEKCRFTANCRVFSTESKIYTHQILNDGEFPKAEDIFKYEIEDTEESENEFDENDFWEDVDLDFDEEEDDDDLFKRPKEKKEYQLEKLADEYFRIAHSFIKSLDNKFNLTETINQKIKEPGFKFLFDNIEIVSWYHMFIMVKIKRALKDKGELKIGMDDFENEISTYDMNGTAKIAAISVKRTQKALNNLFSLVKEFSSEIEEMMVLLGRILNQLDIEFPDYKDFKRPGFDTEK